jgi:hypothetical protein
MSGAGVLTDAFGTRFYTEQMVAAALGISVKEFHQAVAAGYLVPPQTKFGQRRVWPEWQVSQLLRQSRAGAAWAPFR